MGETIYMIYNISFWEQAFKPLQCCEMELQGHFAPIMSIHYVPSGSKNITGVSSHLCSSHILDRFFRGSTKKMEEKSKNKVTVTHPLDWWHFLRQGQHSLSPFTTCQILPWERRQENIKKSTVPHPVNKTFLYIPQGTTIYMPIALCVYEFGGWGSNI